jgi:CheY-like chemotaxis protein
MAVTDDPNPTFRTQGCRMTTVLVIEDDADNLRLMIDVLARAGYAARSARDGRDLPALAGTAAAVILDVSLPGVSGLELCRTLRADPATAALPVLLVSAHAGEGAVQAGLAAGADGYLVKPFSPSQLVTELGQLLDPTAAARAASASLRSGYRSGSRLLAAGRLTVAPARSA